MVTGVETDDILYRIDLAGEGPIDASSLDFRLPLDG